MKNKSTSNLDSKIISFLRFPLILGVIFIHNNPSIIRIPSGTFGNENNVFFNFFSELFSGILSAVSVPLFFLFSGYLFFLSVDNFNKKTYKNKIKSRLKTLLVPYLFWNISLLIFYIIVAATPSLSSFLNHKHPLSFNHIMKALWATGELNAPINYPFWFIRDLMIVVLFSPLIYVYINKLKYIGVILLGILWCSEFSIPIPGFSITSFFFFSCGAYFSINKKQFISFIYKIRYIAYLYPVIVLAELFINNSTIHSFIHKIGILIGICFWILVSKYLVTNYKNKFIYILSNYSFFIFAFHEPLLTIIRKTIYILLKPQSDIPMSSLYFIIVLLVVAISFTLGYALNKSVPKFFSIITGGRTINAPKTTRNVCQ